MPMLPSFRTSEPGRGDGTCLRSHHASPCRFPAHPDPYRGGRAAQVAQDEPRNSLHAGPELEHSMAGLTFRLAHPGFQGSRLIRELGFIHEKFCEAWAAMVTCPSRQETGGGRCNRDTRWPSSPRARLADIQGRRSRQAHTPAFHQDSEFLAAIDHIRDRQLYDFVENPPTYRLAVAWQLASLQPELTVIWSNSARIAEVLLTFSYVRQTRSRPISGCISTIALRGYPKMA